MLENTSLWSKRETGIERIVPLTRVQGTCDSHLGRRPVPAAPVSPALIPPLGPNPTHFFLLFPLPEGPSSSFHLSKLDLASESCSSPQFLLKASLTAGVLTSSLLSASLPSCGQSDTALRIT